MKTAALFAFLILVAVVVEARLGLCTEILLGYMSCLMSCHVCLGMAKMSQYYPTTSIMVLQLYLINFKNDMIWK